jgi:hypothetical protein
MTTQAECPLITVQSFSPCRTLAIARPIQPTRYHLYSPVNASPMK